MQMNRHLVTAVCALEALAFAIWLGGLTILGAVVAPTIFGAVPRAADAMTMVFLKFDRIAMTAAVVVLMCEAFLAVRGGPIGPAGGAPGGRRHPRVHPRHRRGPLVDPFDRRAPLGWRDAGCRRGRRGTRSHPSPRGGGRKGTGHDRFGGVRSGRRESGDFGTQAAQGRFACRKHRGKPRCCRMKRGRQPPLLSARAR